MDKEYFIQLTSNLYRLTLLFPKKEALRYKVRGLADEILANLISILRGDSHSPKNLIAETGRNLEILDSFLEVAKAQNWVSPYDILEVQEEYSKIGGEIEKLKEAEKKETFKEEKVSPEISLPPEVSGRHQKILAILKERGKVQVGELVQVFPDVSKRTLRRDFRSLLEQGLIERIGERNYTFYRLKGEDRYMYEFGQ
ncbi:DeoR/GlpR transcriptional regulator [Patescibacteria group bacterium]|nr:DeoR/GlpR transcriptional regulator [Patescibacteria group bacterium]